MVLQGAFALCLASLPANAETLEEKRTFCAKSGEVALAANHARDSSISKESVMTMIDQTVSEAQARVYFSRLVGMIYAMDGIHDDTARNVAIQMCEKVMGLK